jgi:predicted nucleotidyltransferase
MKTIDEIKKLLDQHKPMLKAKYHIKNIGLFGSIVRGDVNPDSDVDILVEFEKPIGLDFVLLADELEEILGVKIDLVTPNAIKPTMFEYIKQDLIYV